MLLILSKKCETILLDYDIVNVTINMMMIIIVMLTINMMMIIIVMLTINMMPIIIVNVTINMSDDDIVNVTIIHRWIIIHPMNVYTFEILCCTARELWYHHVVDMTSTS